MTQETVRSKEIIPTVALLNTKLAICRSFCITTEPTWYRSHSRRVRRNIKDQRDEDSDSGQAGLSREITVMHGI
jgi:hypothetical protein